MSSLPPANPVNSAIFDNKDERKRYMGECMEVRCNIERCVNTHRGVRIELDKLEAVLGLEAIVWLKSIYETFSGVVHNRWDGQGNMEWIKEVGIAVESILDKLRR